MLIMFPSFESNLGLLLRCAEELHNEQHGRALKNMLGVYGRLTRVRGSARHSQLAEFVEHALDACERGEHKSALLVLMSACSYFAPELAA